MSRHSERIGLQMNRALVDEIAPALAEHVWLVLVSIVVAMLLGNSYGAASS